MPVHVHNHHVHGDSVLLHFAAQVQELVVGEDPVAAPPVSQRPLRGHGNAAGHLHKVSEGSRVVVAVGKEIPVQAVSRGTLRHPAIGREKMPRRLVHQRPTVAGKNAFLQLRGRVGNLFEAQAAVQGAHGAQQVSGIGKARHPGAHAVTDAQVIGRKPASLIPEGEFSCLDDKLPALLSGRKGRYRQLAVHNGQRGSVFEDAVTGPLHTDEAVGEDGETGIAKLHHGGRIGLGIILRKGRKGQQHKKKGKQSFHISSALQSLFH